MSGFWQSDPHHTPGASIRNGVRMLHGPVKANPLQTLSRPKSSHHSSHAHAPAVLTALPQLIRQHSESIPPCQVFPMPLANSLFHEIEVPLPRLNGPSAKISQDIFRILPRSLFLAHQHAVTAIGVFIQFFDPRHNAGTDGVEVNIADKLLQVRIFLTDDGFVSILKKPALAFATAVNI